MTATNHALTGAVIALAIKQPALAIPLAFLSHFVCDAIPHYNPPDLHARQADELEVAWSKKLKNSNFKLLFGIDMFFLAIIGLYFLFADLAGVSNWTVLFSIAAAILPDVLNGRVLIYKLFGYERKKRTYGAFNRFHIWVQWKDVPWALSVEIVWAAVMLIILHHQLS